jgi:hypothetical protein
MVKKTTDMLKITSLILSMEANPSFLAEAVRAERPVYDQGVIISSLLAVNSVPFCQVVKHAILILFCIPE